MVPRTFTRPRVPKNSTDPGQITYVQLPLPMPFFRTALNCLSIIPLYLPWPASVRRGCVTVLLLFVPRRVPRRSLLCRSSVRAHRSEIMFSVLVVVLRPDHIAGQGFSSGQSEIPLIASLRVLRALQFSAGGTPVPPHISG